MKIISSDDVHAALRYPDLINDLEATYAGRYKMPPRNVYRLDDSDPNNFDAFANLPSWNEDFIGVKAFTYFPENAKAGYKSLYSKILLFERKHGEPLALVDGTSVTFWRTGGISGLATRLLAREDAETLFVLGTGNLAPYIIRANCSVRPIKRVMVWGRTRAKAEQVVAEVSKELSGVACSVANDIESGCRAADIIVSATGSHEPLVRGDWVRPGTHTDFIGNHHATKRECDTALVVKSKVYADTRDNLFREGGEILVPISEGKFSKERVVGELAEMCRRAVKLRESADEITLFKSIGMAMSDLVGAGAVFRASTGK